MKNPVFIGQIVLSILVPILAYGGLTVGDLTSWKALYDVLIGAILNPYVIGLVAISLWNAINDPTTVGIYDSKNALGYENLKK